VSRYHNGKTNLDFTVARDSEWQWQWQQLVRMQVCTSLQTDNHANSVFIDRMPFLPPNQQHQRTEGSNGIDQIHDKTRKLSFQTAATILVTLLSANPPWSRFCSNNVSVGYYIRILQFPV